MPEAAPPSARAHTWLSQDLASWWRRRPTLSDPKAFDADVVIIGSGYGAGVALHSLAGLQLDGRPLRLLMLERGDPMLPGAFPDRLSTVPTHVRTHTRPARLFDVHRGDGLNVLVASGLGGGSLINAGVMLPPKPAVFQSQAWPKALREAPPTEADFKAMAAQLGAQPAPVVPGRQAALRQLDPAHYSAVPITVAQAEDATLGVSPCVRCGDCFTGCNVGAKRSVDVQLLAQARQRHPTEALDIVTGVTVDRLQRIGDEHWVLQVHPSDPTWAERQVQPMAIRARAVIVAAGTLGSTEIMLRSRKGLLSDSSPLGQRLSANGDSVATLMGLPMATQAVADPGRDIAQRDSGPTITGIVDWRQGDEATHMVIEDLGVPAALRGVFEELSNTQRVLHRLTMDARDAAAGGHDADPARIDPQATATTLLLAVIGHDQSSGVLSLQADPDQPGRQTLHIDGQQLAHEPGFRARQARLTERVRTLWPDALAMPNVSNQPLPDELETAFGSFTGPLVSVHPLGGCAMGDDGLHGVVNHLGQVFSGDGTAVHANLLVLDGAIVPRSLGINPALTIATLAARAMQRLRQPTGAGAGAGTGVWARLQPGAAPPPAGTLAPRPRWRALRSPPREPPTRLELSECMSAPLRLQWPGRAQAVPAVAQFELTFEPTEVHALTMVNGATAPSTLKLDPQRSTLRLFDVSQSPRVLLADVQLRGHMTFMALERPDDGVFHRLRTIQHTLETWWDNRGESDLSKWLGLDEPLSLWQVIKLLLKGATGGASSAGARLKGALELATHASQRRELRYRLTLDQPLSGISPQAWGPLNGQTVHIDKVLAYTPGGHPLQQLMTGTLRHMPCQSAPAAKELPVQVDLGHTRQVGFPLLRITAQHDQVVALGEMLGLLLYAVRALLPIHAWALRLPDHPKIDPNTAQALRLPGELKGLRREVMLSTGLYRLTRYTAPGRATAGLPPVVMIHGYSASGTTFAHPMLEDQGLGGHLAAVHGRDVWVLDLRSSPGLDGAASPWRFEHMAFEDIPDAIAKVVAHTGAENVDVVAHCMGSAQLNLALLSAPADPSDNLRALPKRLRRVVMSQVTPTFMLSPTNVTRAHILTWLRHYLPMGRYAFTPEVRQQADDLIDRLLSLVPTTPQDWRRENPSGWHPRPTPWVLTRHRMDALYGRTFELANMTDDVLDHIDHFFGPMNLSTLAEVLNYGRTRLVTRSDGSLGRNQPDRIAEVYADIPVMSVHGLSNGMIDPATAELTAQRWRDAQALLAHRQGGALKPGQLQHTVLNLPRHGHQDALIGRGVKAEVYAPIATFLT